MKNIGLITYHATHNYGAVLQAYATQLAVEKMGCRCRVINFQPDTMKYYNALYKFPLGKDIPKNIRSILSFLYRILTALGGYNKSQRIRAGKFGEFIETKLNITEEYRKVNELFEAKFNFDVVITGSDQTWNINCPLWTVHGRTTDYSQAYFLAFAGHSRRASFAASISNTSKEELYPYKNLLHKYDYITIREAETKERIEAVTGKDAHVILDPVFLLNGEEWIRELNITSESMIHEPYILLYSLHSNRRIFSWLSAIRQFARERNLAIVCITPRAFMRVKDIIQIYDAGPLDFLSLFIHASYTFVDSFHGVCFSVIFRKSFLALGNKYNAGDTRKTSLLGGFGLEGRIINDENDINNYSGVDLDYSGYENAINRAVNNQKAHLENIINLG
jgi:hypothetical protein